MVDAYFEFFPDADSLRRGNKMARERMTILFDHSALLRALVLGTSNKTELLLGYGTLYGDMASALNPIGDIYKSQVWQLSTAMGVPDAVIRKQPSADLWAGQTDEEELGFSYRSVDELLYRMVDQRWTKQELVANNFDEGFVDSIYEKIQNSHFKRRLPVIAKISNRTIDRDFRYARDWGK
jgi:NAD+ synthase